MRRDSNAIFQNETVGFFFDTFYDRRNGVVFIVTPIGGRMDGQASDERNYNGDYNPIWDVKTGRFEGGWTFEAAVPFKSLRYRPGREQVWGLQLRRFVRWKNEMSFLTPIDPGVGRAGMFQASQAATLVGLRAPESGRTLEIKPYLIADLTSDLTASPRLENELAATLGIDVLKYGLTDNLAADLTVNTDFAQVEADEQQVNLTRFSLFFPEKREFFLENQGVFAFGGSRSRGGGGDTPILFHSRRIDLDNRLEVPIRAGGRLTGRTGNFELGLLNIQTGDAPAGSAQATNFTVARLKRDLLRRSSVGALVTNRTGTFFGGEKTALSFSRARVELTSQFSFEPSLSFNWVDLPEGRFTTQLVTTRTTYTLSPLMFVSALVQYNSSNNAVASNIRLRWEYRPGSELLRATRHPCPRDVPRTREPHVCHQDQPAVSLLTGC